MIPTDPEILLSIINTKLRDSDMSLDDICDELGTDREEVDAILRRGGHIYVEETNCYK